MYKVTKLSFILNGYFGALRVSLFVPPRHISLWIVRLPVDSELVKYLGSKVFIIFLVVAGIANTRIGVYGHWAVEARRHGGQP